MALPGFPASRIAIAFLALGFGVWLNAQEPGRQQAGADGTVVLLEISGAIGPATSDYVSRGIERAQQQGARLIVLQMDTPGGLDSAMREIIQAILGSTVPVATYVSPQGARAASAGTYILYASHIAAMAPATNLGAATPVSIGGGGTPTPTPTPAPTPSPSPAPDEQAEPVAGEEAGDDAPAEGTDSAPEPATAMERKAINDAVAYIRSLAELRGRNADWAEEAVRSAVSLSAQVALEQNVIDVVANNLSDLLAQIDGRQVSIGSGDVTLETEGLVYERIEPDWRTRLLAVISNPTVAYMLMLVGIYGLIFEGYNPGAIVPGVVGAISLLLALFAFQVLPVNYAGLALILLGIILMIGEFLVPSFGALGIGGVAAFVFGSIILIDSDVPGYGVSLPLIFSIAVTGALTLLGIVWFAMRSRDRPIVSGMEEITHGQGQAMEDFEGEGPVWIHGERWIARSPRPVRKGQTVRVTSAEGLTLDVEPVEPGD